VCKCDDGVQKSFLKGKGLFFYSREKQTLGDISFSRKSEIFVKMLVNLVSNQFRLKIQKTKHSSSRVQYCICNSSWNEKTHLAWYLGSLGRLQAPKRTIGNCALDKESIPTPGSETKGCNSSASQASLQMFKLTPALHDAGKIGRFFRTFYSSASTSGIVLQRRPRCRYMHNFLVSSSATSRLPRCWKLTRPCQVIPIRLRCTVWFMLLKTLGAG
jgi:hypothetical protein